MPYKTFQQGEEATAVDVNTYLMKQAVATFSNASTRGTLLTAPVKGEITARDDAPNVAEMWDGSAWVPLVGMEKLFARTLNQTVPANSYSDYGIALPACPMAGGVILDMEARVDSPPSGSVSQITGLTYVPGSTTPALQSAVSQSGSVYNTLQIVNLRGIFHWANMARNQVPNIRLRVTNNTGSGAALNWSGIIGTVRYFPTTAAF